MADHCRPAVPAHAELERHDRDVDRPVLQHHLAARPAPRPSCASRSWPARCKVAELRLLKSQLNPHFLFNCLNSVRALIADDPTGAQKAVTQLARTLRYTLTAGQEEVVSLERELEIVADYLELESLRLGERSAHRAHHRRRSQRSCTFQ